MNTDMNVLTGKMERLVQERLPNMLRWRYGLSLEEAVEIASSGKYSILDGSSLPRGILSSYDLGFAYAEATDLLSWLSPEIKATHDYETLGEKLLDDGWEIWLEMNCAVKCQLETVI